MDDAPGTSTGILGWVAKGEPGATISVMLSGP